MNKVSNLILWTCCCFPRLITTVKIEKIELFIGKYSQHVNRKATVFFKIPIAVIPVRSVVKYFFVLKGMQMRRKGQCNAELTILACSCAKLLITAITAIDN